MRPATDKPGRKLRCKGWQRIVYQSVSLKPESEALVLV